MKERNYQVGIIACGNIAKRHLAAFRLIPGVQVVAGADISPEARADWKENHGVSHMYPTAQEMFDNERLDIVAICTWPPLRPEMVELACARGVRGIVAEKPMAVDLAGCDRMINAAQHSGTVLIVHHQRRFRRRFVRAKELIDSGAIGRVEQVTVYNGGDLLTSSSHMVDTMSYLLGDPGVEWVIGQVDTREPNFHNGPIGLQEWDQTHKRYGHHVETGAFGIVQFRGGARGLIEVGIVNRRGSYRATVYGTDGHIEISGDHPEPGEPWLRARVRDQAGWLWFEAEQPQYEDTLEMFTQLVDVLEHGGTHPSDMHHARNVHEVLMAVYESSLRRARIDLPLEGTASPLEAILAQPAASHD